MCSLNNTYTQTALLCYSTQLRELTFGVAGMNIQGRVPEPFNVQAQNLSREFSLWLENFEYSLSLATTELTDTKKKALLLTCAGLEVRRLADGLAIDTTKNEYEGIKTALKNYFGPASSPVFERYLFRSRTQKSDETICAYASSLRSLARTCAFNDFIENQNIRDQFIAGIFWFSMVS